MPPARITVPTEDRRLVLIELLARYGAKAEVVHRAVGDYLDGTCDLPPLLAARAELAAAAELIEQLGWELNVPARTLELAGEPAILRSTVTGALGAAFDLLSTIAGSSEAEIDPGAVRANLRQAQRLLNEFEKLKGSTPPPANAALS